MNWNLKSMTYKQLEIIMQKFAMQDKANINGDLTGLGFTEDIAEKIAASISNYNQTILIYNDFGLILTKKLLEKGIKEVHLAFGQWREKYITDKNGKERKSGEILFDEEKLYNLYERLPIIKETPEIKLVRMNDSNKKKFDLVIMNPPYGKSSSLAAPIIFKSEQQAEELIFLAPENILKYDYILNAIDLDALDVFDNLFEDATIGKLVVAKYSSRYKNSVKFEDLVLLRLDPALQTLRNKIKSYNSRHLESSIYYISGPLNPKFDKTVENASKQPLPEKFISIKDKNCRELLNQNLMFYSAVRNSVDGVHFDSAADRNYNIDNNWDTSLEFQRHGDMLLFSTLAERENFKNWWYSCTQKYSSKKECNRRGIANMICDLLQNCVSASAGILYYNEYLPRVDWSRSWTDEEILAELGYDDAELDEYKSYRNI